MNNTALGAENKKEQTINFISEAHEKFYYEKLKEVRYQDVYHKALCYCLGIDCMKNTTTKIANIKAYMVTTHLQCTKYTQSLLSTGGTARYVRGRMA